MAGTYLILFFIISLILLAEEGSGFHPKCPSFHCGELGQLSFPFSNRTHPECGLFVVDNCNEGYRPMIQLGKDGPWFSISNISQDNTLWLHNQEFQYNFYCESLKLLSFPTNPLFSFEVASNVLTLFKCPPTPHIANFTHLCNDSSQSIIYNNQTNSGLSPLTDCSVIQPLVTRNKDRVFFRNIYPSLFFLQVQVRQECYECHEGGGQCQSNDKGHFRCSTSKTGNAKGHLIIVVVAIVAPGIGALIILALCFRKTLSSHNSKVFWKKKTKNYNNIRNFLKTNGLLAPKRYRYSEIKRMTNSFKYKLGQGGYGGVYKGKLLDGCDVAVKVLNDLKGNGEEFINEVVSISRTSHVNIVRLFGYCFEGHRRALIYEFVPNGSLEKLIFEKNPRNNQLKWEKLFQIALGIARGLEYLHCDCHTRILHFDIKPHNILLDENLCPKISDFGLAKICPKRESIISMTGARGTIGYIAPELCSRQFGEVSHKSDIYSYGMMVLEMVGGRKNLDVGVDRTSEIYFPHWIYKRLELDEELGLQDIENEEDKECAMKLITVSLWCIQTKPSSRPAISRVVKMLEGSLDSLQFPPKPFLSSPTPEPADPSPSGVH